MSTSKLQSDVGNLLRKSIVGFDVYENVRPEWLLSSNITRLELDFYIPELKIAFEIQGIQHFVFSPFFHSDYSDFIKQLKYDDEKKDLCYGAQVRLIEIVSFADACVEINAITESLPNFISKMEPQLSWPGLGYANKERKARGEKPISYFSTLSVLQKFKRQLWELRIIGDPISTPEQIVEEKRKFVRKTRKHKELVYFNFHYLGYDEIAEILRGYIELSQS